MLTSDHSIVEYTRGVAIPDRLTRVTHRHYLDYAHRMLAAYRAGVGMARRELHRAVANILAGEPDCPRQRIAAFCRLLDDAGEFDTDRKASAANLRLQVFTIAAKLHPLVSERDQIFERGEHEAKQLIAQQVGRSWEEIEKQLYVDVIDRQPLKSFERFASTLRPGSGQAEALLSRYNLAQLQACLYKAQRMSVEATTDFAAIVRYAKLARLLVDVRKLGGGRYQIDLSGPATVLHETRRYGINFARFVAALASCRGWKMRASVMTPWGSTAQLRISSEDGYRSHIDAPAEFDSEIEEGFSQDWGDEQGGWRLRRDAGILHDGQTTFVPDFLLRHADGREVYMEIVGFWTPEYLAAKRKTIAKFKDRKILLAISKRTAKVEGDQVGVVIYGTKLKAAAVLEAVNRFMPQPVGFAADGDELAAGVVV